MTRVRLTPGVIDDLDRIVAHLLTFEIDGAQARADEIISAIDALTNNPLIGRPAGEDKHEWVIARGLHGYLALYSYVIDIDAAIGLAVRAPREAGFVQR